MQAEIDANQASGSITGTCRFSQHRNFEGLLCSRHCSKCLTWKLCGNGYCHPLLYSRRSWGSEKWNSSLVIQPISGKNKIWTQISHISTFSFYHSTLPLRKSCSACMNPSTGGSKESKSFNTYVWDCSPTVPNGYRCQKGCCIWTSQNLSPHPHLKRLWANWAVQHLGSSCQRQAGEHQAVGSPGRAMTASLLQMRCSGLGPSLQLPVRGKCFLYPRKSMGSGTSRPALDFFCRCLSYLYTFSELLSPPLKWR